MISLITRNPLRVDVMRDRGALAREVDGVRIENIYRIQIMNASENNMNVQLKASGLSDLRILNSQGELVTEIAVGPASNLLIPVKVSTNVGAHEPGNYPIHFDVIGKEVSDSELITRNRDEKSSFIVPR
jgi:polyferredoxin